MTIADRPLSTLSDDEWEQLCDGCGRCCMHKFEDTDTGEMLYTSVACRLFDDASCRCRDYGKRLLKVADCLSLRSFSMAQMRWLPATCAYRLRAEDKPLPTWHPLMAAEAEAVHAAGMSMRGRSIPEDAVPEDDWPDHIMDDVDA
jgi:uncharacterized cysteine cluster protein YcgN (CxxCxxCC family)